MAGEQSSKSVVQMLWLDVKSLGNFPVFLCVGGGVGGVLLLDEEALVHWRACVLSLPVLPLIGRGVGRAGFGRAHQATCYVYNKPEVLLFSTGNGMTSSFGLANTQSYYARETRQKPASAQQGCCLSKRRFHPLL